MSKNDQTPDSDKAYVGPERRKAERRKKDRDRRDKLRFEIEKDPRRTGQDRRQPQPDIWKDYD